MTVARVWRSKLWLPVELREQMSLNREAGVREKMWPKCYVCTALNMKRGMAREDAWQSVEAYGVEAFGRTLGGIDYTDEWARCHGEKDIIRIEGFRWDKIVEEWKQLGEKADKSPILAAIEALPFFGPGAIRVIPQHVFLNFMAKYRGSS
jgi:hypothetical protein